VPLHFLLLKVTLCSTTSSASGANRQKKRFAYTSSKNSLFKNQITFLFKHDCGATATHTFFNHGKYKEKHLLKQTKKRH